MARPQLKISVPQPCSENWAEMTLQAQGRFCASCATTVVDFRQFTDKQLLEYFANVSGKTCGRFTTAQLNRPVYAGALPKQNFFPRAFAAVALFLGISSQTQGQNIPDQPVPSSYIETNKNAAAERTVAKTPEKVSGDSLVISGRLLDAETKEPIPFGNVAIKGTSVYTSTDIEGKFRIALADSFKLQEFVLYMPNVGYKSVEFLIERKQLPLKRDFTLTQDSTVIIMGFTIPVIENNGDNPSKPSSSVQIFWWRLKNLFRKNDQQY